MTQIDRKQLTRLYQKREESRGKEIVLMLMNLDASYSILNKNHKELRNANDSYMRDWSIVEPANKAKLGLFLLEFSRLLHNYLASFASFVDHTRYFAIIWIIQNSIKITS